MNAGNLAKNFWAANHPELADDAIRQFTAVNYRYFIFKWKFARGFSQWNWAAFFFGPLWFALRKNLFWSLALAGLLIACDFYFSANPYHFSIAIELPFFSGLFANLLYYRKFKKIQTDGKQKKLGEAAQFKMLRLGGGRDWRQPAWLLAAMAGMMLLLPSVFGIHLFKTRVWRVEVQSLVWRLWNPDPQAELTLLREDYLLTRLQGAFARSLSVNENSLKLAAFKLGNDHPLTIGMQLDLIENKINAGAYQEALRLTDAALKQYQLQFGPEHMFTTFILNQRVASNLRRGIYDEAKSTCFNCLLILEKYPKNITHPVILSNLAAIYSNMGVIQQAYCQYEEAEKNQQEALELALQASKGYSLEVCPYLERQGDLYKEEMKLDEATECYLRAKGIVEKYLGQGNPMASALLLKLGEIRVLNRQGEAALPMLLKAAEMNETYYGPDHIATAESDYQLSKAYFLLGRLHEAEVHLSRCLQAAEQAIGKHNAIFANYLRQQAEMDLFRNDARQAEKILRESLEIYTQIYGKDNPRLLEPLEQLQSLYEKTGNSVAQFIAAERIRKIKSVSGKQIPMDSNRLSI